MPLDLNQLQTARQAVLDNARGLLGDALVLLNENSFARGYALSVLAREEMGKLAMLVRACYVVTQGEQFNWKRLAKRMTSHQSKLEAAALTQILYSTNTSGCGDPKTELQRLLKNPKNRALLNVGKQDGLYVRVTEAGMTKPSDTTHDDAWPVYHDAHLLFQFFETGESTDHEASFFLGIHDLYGKFVCLAENLIEAPGKVRLPR